MSNRDQHLAPPQEPFVPSDDIAPPPPSSLRPVMLYIHYTGADDLLMAHEVNPDLSYHPLGKPVDPEAFIRRFRKDDHRGPARLDLIPPHTLAVNAEAKALAWYTPPMFRELFFDEKIKSLRPYHGKRIHHPSLVWVVRGGHLKIAFHFCSEGLGPDTPLYPVYYPQVTPGTGGVHLCGVTKPRWRKDIGALIEAWVDAFFDSRWTSEGGDDFLRILQKGGVGGAEVAHQKPLGTLADFLA